MDTNEVKRRIEQMLPINKTFKHHRGMSISDQDCTHLCSLADHVWCSPAPNTNLNIVDDDSDGSSSEQFNERGKGSYGEVVTNKRGATTHAQVEYIRHFATGKKSNIPPSRQLPSFIEHDSYIDGKDTTQLYDNDVTPYESEVDDPPIVMVP